MANMANIVKQEELKQLEEFIKFFNDSPTKVKINRMANNSKYIPINEIERLLDTLFNGLWQTESYNYSVVANEVVCSLELSVYHPIAKTWIKRVGVGAAMIQTIRDKPITVENKHKNTLVKDFPHAKAEAFKNAAKSLGAIFGRNLNRDDSNNELESLTEKYTDYKLNKDITEAINNAPDMDSLKQIWESLDTEQQGIYKILLSNRKKQL